MNNVFNSIISRAFVLPFSIIVDMLIFFLTIIAVTIPIAILIRILIIPLFLGWKFLLIKDLKEDTEYRLENLRMNPVKRMLLKKIIQNLIKKMWIRFFVRSAISIIPIVNLIPWNTIETILTDIAMVKAYKIIEAYEKGKDEEDIGESNYV